MNSDNDTDHQPPTPDETPVEKRADPRKNVIFDCQLTIDGEVVTCDIVNISAGGARLRFYDLVPGDGDSILHIEDYGDFPGTLVWAAGNVSGFKFKEKRANGHDIAMAMAAFGQA